MPEPSEPTMWRSEMIASDAIGRLMEFWGFKRNMGRIWTVLYLSDDPLTAQDLRERLQLSSGAVSMTLKDLSRWGTVRKVWIQGERRDYFTAEGDLWKMISRVFRERELVEVQEAIANLERALEALDERGPPTAPDEERRATVQRERIRQLLELARLGLKLLQALLSEARVDATALARVLLGRDER
ncbi:MAG TPA: HTH domain-containing protein [Sandaracinaceae bacterium LLY-WYZ-13_1]|nr:HTH domain-containing protein [Sandaracinaceae bacterium LLY-WYZ-13_1]